MTTYEFTFHGDLWAQALPSATNGGTPIVIPPVDPEDYETLGNVHPSGDDEEEILAADCGGIEVKFEFTYMPTAEDPDNFYVVTLDNDPTVHAALKCDDCEDDD